MFITHAGKSPQIDSEAFCAPDATICGAVSIGKGSRIMHGARIIAEGGKIVIGNNVIIMQNAVVRSTSTHNCIIGSSVLIGPTAHIVGATIENEVFLATGTSIFHGSHIGAQSVVRIHGVVHVNTHLAAKTSVPIGWVAVGNPAQLFSTDQAEELWAVQEPLNFAKTVYGVDQPLNACLSYVTSSVSDKLETHLMDTAADT